MDGRGWWRWACGPGSHQDTTAPAHVSTVWSVVRRPPYPHLHPLPLTSPPYVTITRATRPPSPPYAPSLPLPSHAPQEPNSPLTSLPSPSPVPPLTRYRNLTLRLFPPLTPLTSVPSTNHQNLTLPLSFTSRKLTLPSIPLSLSLTCLARHRTPHPPLLLPLPHTLPRHRDLNPYLSFPSPPVALALSCLAVAVRSPHLTWPCTPVSSPLVIFPSLSSPKVLFM